MRWIPKYIPSLQEKRAREKVFSVDWNSAFNTLIDQGNHNTKAIEDLIELGNLSVQRAVLSEDSLKLGGQHPSYYAVREKVIGRDEDVYRPGNTWAPTKPEHPATKRYVDQAKAYMEKLFEEYTVYYATGITILGVYKNHTSFIKEHPKGKKGDAYVVADNIYTWDPIKNDWYNAGPIRGDKGDKGDTGQGLKAGGLRGQIPYKLSDANFDIGYTEFTADEVVLSETTRRITVGGTAPQSARDGDIWFKI